MVKVTTRVFSVLRNDLVFIRPDFQCIFSDLEDGAGFQLL